jgi:predicted transcriptional regulator YheO
MGTVTDREWLLEEAKKLASALAETFSPLCEVVVHDLTNPEHTIVQISNNLSGRSVGDAATEMGLARMTDPTFPDVVANYANSFADGRPAKSTSVGLRDKSGAYIAAICLNVDVSYLRAIGGYLQALTEVKPGPEAVSEVLTGTPRTTLSAKILAFAAQRNRDPRALSGDEKRELLRRLAQDGELEIRGAAEKIGAMIGVSRSNVYYYLRDMGPAEAPAGSGDAG